MGAPRACAEREANITGLYWWDVGCDLAVVEGAGQGRAEHSMDWSGMAWHGRGIKDRLWS